MKKEKGLDGKRIGIFGKGGAGKSTFTAIFSRFLSNLGYQVCILDADSTNVGFSHALGLQNPEKSMLDYFGGMVFSGGAVTCPVDDPTPLQDREIVVDDLSPEYFVQDETGIKVFTAGKISHQGAGAGCDGPVSKIARDLILHQREREPVTLIDFKAGFEDSARGAVTGLDFAIVIIDPTIASIEMATSMQTMFDQLQEHRLPATSHIENPDLVAIANEIYANSKMKAIFFVLNKVPDQETKIYLQDQLAQKGIKAIACIQNDPGIPVAWLKGSPVPPIEKPSDLQRIVGSLEEECNGRL